jgi:hypothetical protein
LPRRAIILTFASMFRFLARFLGFWLVAAALVAAVVDGAKSIAASAFVTTPLAEAWAAVARLTAEGGDAPAAPPAWPLDVALAWLGAAPTFAALAAIGVVLLVLGSRRRRPYLDRKYAA